MSNIAEVALIDNLALTIEEQLATLDEKHRVECFVLPKGMFRRYCLEMGARQEQVMMGICYTFSGTPVVRGSRFMVGVRAVFT